MSDYRAFIDQCELSGDFPNKEGKANTAHGFICV